MTNRWKNNPPITYPDALLSKYPHSKKKIIIIINGQYRHAPASTSFPLFGVGQANPLLCHSADVVIGVKVGLLNLASIYHINNIIYGDAVRNSGERQRGKKRRPNHSEKTLQSSLSKMHSEDSRTQPFKK